MSCQHKCVKNVFSKPNQRKKDSYCAFKPNISPIINVSPIIIIRLFPKLKLFSFAKPTVAMICFVFPIYGSVKDFFTTFGKIKKSHPSLCYIFLFSYKL